MSSGSGAEAKVEASGEVVRQAAVSGQAAAQPVEPEALQVARQVGTAAAGKEPSGAKRAREQPE
jgi:hypothetical protein